MCEWLSCAPADLFKWVYVTNGVDHCMWVYVSTSVHHCMHVLKGVACAHSYGGHDGMQLYGVLWKKISRP
jgi:hypothetical protein